MERALAALARRYHESGWIDAAIGKPHASYDESDGSVAVVVPIKAGPRYRIGEVHAHGGGAETRAEVVAAMEQAWLASGASGPALPLADRLFQPNTASRAHSALPRGTRNRPRCDE